MTLRSLFAAACGLALVTAAALPAQASTNLLVNGGFESQTLSSGSYYYPTQGSTVDSWYYYGPALVDGVGGSAWWPGSAAPAGFEGDNFAALQATSVLAQNFTLASAGSLELSWLDAGRPNTGCCNGDQTYKVFLLDYGTSSLIDVGQYSTFSGQAFTQETAKVGGLSGGAYALIFQGQSTLDNTAFIDNVKAVTAVPEPSTWALMFLGVGATGAVLRRRRGAALAA